MQFSYSPVYKLLDYAVDCINEYSDTQDVRILDISVYNALYEVSYRNLMVWYPEIEDFRKEEISHDIASDLILKAWNHNIYIDSITRYFLKVFDGHRILNGRFYKMNYLIEDEAFMLKVLESPDEYSNFESINMYTKPSDSNLFIKDYIRYIIQKTRRLILQSHNLKNNVNTLLFPIMNMILSNKTDILKLMDFSYIDRVSIKVVITKMKRIINYELLDSYMYT